MTRHPSDSLVREGTSFADTVKQPPKFNKAVILSSCGEFFWIGRIWTSSASLSENKSGDPSLKRWWLPNSGEIYKWWLRSRHKTKECRHLLMWRHCSSVGHIAIKYPLILLPRFDSDAARKKVRSKRVFSEAKPLLHVIQSLLRLRSTSSDPLFLIISFPISEEISKSKEGPQKILIIKILSWNATVDNYGSITPYDDYVLLLMPLKKSRCPLIPL